MYFRVTAAMSRGMWQLALPCPTQQRQKEQAKTVRRDLVGAAKHSLQQEDTLTMRILVTSLFTHVPSPLHPISRLQSAFPWEPRFSLAEEAEHGLFTNYCVWHFF